ncbi:hypothetical protein LEMLEM_LOCUS7123, partial [Lemmus lemmus]
MAKGLANKRPRPNPAPAMALALISPPQTPIHWKSPIVKTLSAKEKTFVLVWLLTPTPNLHVAAFLPLPPIRMWLPSYPYPQSARGCLLTPTPSPHVAAFLPLSPICTWLPSYPYPQSARGCLLTP